MLLICCKTRTYLALSFFEILKKWIDHYQDLSPKRTKQHFFFTTNTQQLVTNSEMVVLTTLFGRRHKVHYMEYFEYERSSFHNKIKEFNEVIRFWKLFNFESEISSYRAKNILRNIKFQSGCPNFTHVNILSAILTFFINWRKSYTDNVSFL